MPSLLSMCAAGLKYFSQLGQHMLWQCVDSSSLKKPHVHTCVYANHCTAIISKFCGFYHFFMIIFAVHHNTSIGYLNCSQFGQRWNLEWSKSPFLIEHILLDSD
ncbi:hypothetical protein XENOCAPTIV_018173 [Xenoophorus captivus]|uniref:Uncharacterized protein n=1 Tax=Xenoophorus captivus TaxID=1517983 RepID=A0ABV0RJA9_9TELE